MIHLDVYMQQTECPPPCPNSYKGEIIIKTTFFESTNYTRIRNARIWCKCSTIGKRTTANWFPVTMLFLTDSRIQAFMTWSRLPPPCQQWSWLDLLYWLRLHALHMVFAFFLHNSHEGQLANAKRGWYYKCPSSWSQRRTVVTKVIRNWTCATWDITRTKTADALILHTSGTVHLKTVIKKKNGKICYGSTVRHPWAESAKRNRRQYDQLFLSQAEAFEIHVKKSEGWWTPIQRPN